jgi:hypothetical protein
MWMFLLFLAAAPFWQEKGLAEWSDIQIAQFLNDSPWAHPVKTAAGKVVGLPVQAYLASSNLAEQAEKERTRRAALRHKTEDTPLAEEYRLWFEDNRKEQVILAVRVGNNTAFSEESEVRRMQDDTLMHSGNNKVKMSSYFPPSSTDPFVHFAFPRSAIQPQEKFLDFEVYLPGIASPFRGVAFTVADLLVDGKPDY